MPTNKLKPFTPDMHVPTLLCELAQQMQSATPGAEKGKRLSNGELLTATHISEKHLQSVFYTSITTSQSANEDAIFAVAKVLLTEQLTRQWAEAHPQETLSLPQLYFYLAANNRRLIGEKREAFLRRAVHEGLLNETDLDGMPKAPQRINFLKDRRDAGERWLWGDPTEEPIKQGR